MPREGWRGCSGTCPPHLEGGGLWEASPPLLPTPGSWEWGLGWRAGTPADSGAEPGGSGTAPPPLPARLGRMLGGGSAAGSPPFSTSPARRGRGARCPPFPAPRWLFPHAQGSTFLPGGSGSSSAARPSPSPGCGFSSPRGVFSPFDAPELSSLSRGPGGICKLFLLPVRLQLDGAGGRALFPGRITPPG